MSYCKEAKRKLISLILSKRMINHTASSATCRTSQLPLNKAVQQNFFTFYLKNLRDQLDLREKQKKAGFKKETCSKFYKINQIDELASNSNFHLHVSIFHRLLFQRKLYFCFDGIRRISYLSFKITGFSYPVVFLGIKET